MVAMLPPSPSLSLSLSLAEERIVYVLGGQLGATVPHEPLHHFAPAAR